MDTLDVGQPAQPVEKTLEVKNRELAGFAVIGVPPKRTSLARRPGVGNRHEFAAHVVP